MALTYNVGDLIRIRDYSAFTEELVGKNIIGKITRITSSPSWPYKVIFSDPVNGFHIEQVANDFCIMPVIDYIDKQVI